MIISMPAEEWAEWMEWLNRLEFAQKTELLPGDRAFSANGQNWLHVWHRNVCIGMLRFVAEEVIVGTSDGTLTMETRPCLQKCIRRAGEVRNIGGEQQYVQVPIAEVEMPGNITNFRSICISYLNPVVMNFLRLMRPLFTSKVHLIIGSSEDVYWTASAFLHRQADYQTVLAHLLPILAAGPLEAISFSCYSGLLRFIHDHFPTVLANAKMLNTYLDNDIGWTVQCLADWLFSPREEQGQHQSPPPPRRLILYIESSDNGYDAFMQEIRTRFLSSERQQKCAFFIKVFRTRSSQETLIENVPLGERLRMHSVRVPNNGLYSFEEQSFAMLISCWPIKAEDKERIVAEEERKLLLWDVDNMDRSIYVWSPVIGQGIKDAGIKADEQKPAGTSSSQQTSSNKRSHGEEQEEEETGTSGEASTSCTDNTAADEKRKKHSAAADPEE